MSATPNLGTPNLFRRSESRPSLAGYFSRPVVNGVTTVVLVRRVGRCRRGTRPDWEPARPRTTASAFPPVLSENAAVAARSGIRDGDGPGSAVARRSAVVRLSPRPRHDGTPFAGVRPLSEGGHRDCRRRPAKSRRTRTATVRAELFRLSGTVSRGPKRPTRAGGRRYRALAERLRDVLPGTTPGDGRDPDARSAVVRVSTRAPLDHG